MCVLVWFAIATEVDTSMIIHRDCHAVKFVQKYENDEACVSCERGPVEKFGLFDMAVVMPQMKWSYNLPLMNLPQ